MTPKDDEFIELHRTFHELSDHAGKSDDVDLSQVFHVRNHLTWDGILKTPRTVILSEAGSGKTEEIRQVASRLRAEGKAAFFLRLELIPSDYEIAFEVGTLEEFNAWLASGDLGWLLLDSVDEARLRSPQDFERAIRKLGQIIKAAKERVKIVLTGRTHAWRPKTDFDVCERHIGAPPQRKTTVNESLEGPYAQPEEPSDFDETIEIEEQAKESDPGFKIVALDDLSREQVKAFAVAKGMQDTSKFLDEIERLDAWSSTMRPQDLEDVIALWTDKGKIGSRLEIMRNSIDRRLKERDQQRAEVRHLSDERVREGVMLIAAATTLAQTQIIGVPDGASNSKGLSLKTILTDWTDADITALLSRPIFDAAIYGTVRFHHRSVREYLTAVWFAKLLEKPASRRAIEALLFKKQYGLDVIVPTMRPILPWLAIFDDKIRERVRKIAPVVIFEGGDPGALPLPTRQEILAEVCENLAHDTIVHSATEYAAVQRFAQADIADDIGELLRQYASNDSIVGFLIRMVWLGRLKILLPEAKTVALSNKISQYTRSAAFRAVREFGDEKDHLDVRRSFIDEAPRLNREWAGELITGLVPSQESTAWVLVATKKSEDRQRYSIDKMADAITEFTDATQIEELPVLLAGMRALLDELPVIERGYCDVSKRFSWVIKASVHGVERLIKARHPYALHRSSLEILRKFRAVREWENEFKDIRVEFERLVTGWTELNDASFWHDIAATREGVNRKKGERLTDYWQAQVFGSFWKFETVDFDRVLRWMESRPDQDDKLVALTLGFAIYYQNGKSKIWRGRLKSAASKDPELESKLEQMLNPPPQQLEYKKQERKWKNQEAVRTRRTAAKFEKDKAYILAHIDLIRDPKFPNPGDLSQVQWYLHQKVHEERGGSSKWSDGRWRELIPLFGEDVANAYRDGAMAYWRNYRPVMRSEGAEPNKTFASTIFGLGGLEIESRERSGGLAGLNQNEAELATRYALNELNGFPSWFQALYAAQREAALNVIKAEINYEMQTGVPDQDVNYVLSDVGWSGEWIWNDIAPFLFDKLEKIKPNNASQLNQILKIIQSSNMVDSEIARLAASKINGGIFDNAADWFGVWIGVDPAAAIPKLARHLDALPDQGQQTDLAMKFVVRLWGGRRSESFGARGGFKKPEHLKSLYVLMHKHISVTDDIERAGGGVFSPGLRDNAQEARNRILQELNNISGKEAFLALEEIAALSRQTQSFPYLEILCKTKAEKDADLLRWTPTNVREFHVRQDRTPSTHKELAELAVLRFLDLKDDLEEGDDSVAAVVKTITEETKLRNYLGHELRQKAFNRYAIPQEEEMADKKRPDLRFHGVGIDAPVPVELKIAENWSGPDLFERLENQLAGDYLRDIRSARGIFALVYRGDKAARWQIPGTKRLVDFEEIISALRDHWMKISPNYPGVDEITIIGIDLGKRTT